jgi:uncharacterized membrane protein
MQATINQQNTSTSNQQRFANHFSRFWILWFSLLYGIYVGLPFLAPLFMQWGAELPARLIYTVYSFLCHQLPERSYFLFGPNVSYNLAEIQAAWQATSNPMILRQFIGNPEMGWKVAWSDRMVSMFTSILFFAWIWWPLRMRLRQLHRVGLFLLALPIAVDGTTHFVSDMFGMYEGFRYTNAWLAALTNHAFPISFYVGDAWGSFNAWMRLITGGLFGLGVVWFGFPYLDEVFQAQAKLAELKKRAKDQVLEHAFAAQGLVNKTPK